MESDSDVCISSLICGYWNINGHSSKYLGDKLLDQEFINVVSECDIIGLGEIQSERDVDIPGFKRIKQKIREKNSIGPKIAGGLGVFVREKFENLVELVPNSCDDSIWIRVKNEGIYIGTYYVSPQYSKSRDIEFSKTLNEEFLNFKEKGIVIVQGDLNARTANNIDFVKSGKHYDSLEEEMDENDTISTDDPILRNSEDKITNSRGKELLDLCMFNKLIIMNGRKKGDIFGRYTCHNWNGSSVVDYFLTPLSFVDRVSYFSVGDFIPWLSDHCIIKAKILLMDKYASTATSEETSEVHPGFLWNETSISNYRTNLQGVLWREKYVI